MTTTIGDDIIALFNDEDTADVTIITASNERIRAHKLILSIRSVVFKKMLHHSMTESNTNEIHIIDFDGAIIRLFLRFLYHDHLSEDTLIKYNTELYTMACKYQVEGLERLCEYSMCRCMSSSNVMDLLQLSDLHNSLSLRRHALLFLKKYSSEVVQQPKFFPKLLSLLDHNNNNNSSSSSSSRDCGEEVGHDAVEMMEDKNSINHHDHDRRAGGKCFFME
jgi:speckle-type POZ protein